MSLADCPKCWMALCSCGYEYRDWSPERLREQIAMLENVLSDKQSGALRVPEPRPPVTAADYMAVLKL